jgi:hypothetical protein
LNDLVDSRLRHISLLAIKTWSRALYVGSSLFLMGSRLLRLLLLLLKISHGVVGFKNLERTTSPTTFLQTRRENLRGNPTEGVRKGASTFLYIQRIRKRISIRISIGALRLYFLPPFRLGKRLRIRIRKCIRKGVGQGLQASSKSSSKYTSTYTYT